MRPAQAKTNVMISGLSELRLQHLETWNETKPPPQLMPLLTEEASPIHLLAWDGLLRSELGHADNMDSQDLGAWTAAT